VLCEVSNILRFDVTPQGHYMYEYILGV
jgi:hypothetical protein